MKIWIFCRSLVDQVGEGYDRDVADLDVMYLDSTVKGRLTLQMLQFSFRVICTNLYATVISRLLPAA